MYGQFLQFLENIYELKKQKKALFQYSLFRSTLVTKINQIKEDSKKDFELLYDDDDDDDDDDEELFLWYG